MISHDKLDVLLDVHLKTALTTVLDYRRYRLFITRNDRRLHSNVECARRRRFVFLHVRSSHDRSSALGRQARLLLPVSADFNVAANWMYATRGGMGDAFRCRCNRNRRQARNLKSVASRYHGFTCTREPLIP